MIEELIALTLRRRIIVWFVFLFVAAYGYISFVQLPIEAYPDIADTTSQVVTQVPGLAAEEVELMLTAFLAHRSDVPDGLRAGHLRDELREQMRFGPRSLQHLIAEEHQFLEHHLLRAKHELQRALVQFGGFRFCICFC